MQRPVSGITYIIRRLLPAILAIGSLLDSVSSIPAQTWTATSLPSTEYLRVASSADGMTLLAGTYDGPVYQSTNAGVSWAALTIPLPAAPYWIVLSNWHGVASSALGNTIAAVGFTGPLCVSTNAGVTWSETNIGGTFQGVACSADGRRLVAVNAQEFAPPVSSGIFLSDDGGSTWTLGNAPGNMWLSVACSADGTTMAAVGPAVYVSTNSGATWYPTASPSGSYISIACSADGTRLIACTFSPGGVFTSTDTGATWTRANLTNLDYFGVASSADGTKLAAAAHAGPIYRSLDSGITWTPMDAPYTNWYALASSADGNALVAASMDNNGTYLGLVYTWQSIPAPRLNLAPSTGNLVLSWTLPSRKFVLQQNWDFTTSNWTDVTTAPVLNCTSLQNEVTIPATPGSMFYRLISR
jgi:photosystem II stability/assembly factor-like uncharacterized protein